MLVCFFSFFILYWIGWYYSYAKVYMGQFTTKKHFFSCGETF